MCRQAKGLGERFYIMLLNEAIQNFANWKNYSSKNGTVRGYNLALRQLALFLKNCELENIELRDVMEWFNLMKTLNWDHNSFIPKAMAVRKFFEFYRKQGFEVIDPWLIPIPHREYKLQKVATKEDYQKLLNVIPKNNDPRHIRNLAIINLLWDTGARNGEILSLNINDIDLIEMTAVIKTEKSKGARPVREIFWTKKTNDSLKNWIKKRRYLDSKKTILKDEDALFISICNGGVHNNAGKRFANKGVGEMLRRYCIKAKIENMNAHSFRHHMGHQIVKKGGSNSDVSNILGHSSLQSSFVYTQMTNVELKKRYKIFVK